MIADDAHLSTDRLADLSADALAPAEAAAARTHLATCNDCRATSDLLSELPSLLAGVPPPPIPAEVTARVVAAIEREQIARAGEADEVRSLDAGQARTAPATWRGRFAGRVGAAVLGTAAVLGAGYLVVGGVLGGGTEQGDSPTAGLDAADDTGGGQGDDTEESAEAGPNALLDAPAYTTETLDEDVQRLLAEPTDVTGSELRTPSESVPGEEDPSGDDDGAAGSGTYDAARTTVCVAGTQQLAGSEAEPLAVDIGTYDGVPAVVVVLPESTDRSGTTDEVDVWVVATSCLDRDESDGEAQAAALEVLAREAVRR